MHARTNCVAALGMLLAAGLASAAEPDHAAMLRNHESRMALVRRGHAALSPLFELAVGEDAGLAAEAERVIRWIAVRSNDDVNLQWATLDALVERARKRPNVAARRLALSVVPIVADGRGSADLAAHVRDKVIPAVAVLLADPPLAPAAADTLAQIRDPAATRALADAFAKAQGELRVAVGKALASRRDPAAVSVVGKMLGDKALRDAALESLADTPGAAACEAILAALDAAEPAFRATMLRARMRRDCRRLLPAARKYAESGDATLRAAAIEVLGRVGDPSAIALVRAATESQAPSVRAAALRAYIRLAERVLELPPVPTLGAPVPPKALKMLAHVLKQTKSDADRVAALGVLGRVHAALTWGPNGMGIGKLPSAVPVIAPLLRHENPRVAVAAARALQTRMSLSKEDMAAFCEALKAPDPHVRCALLEGLGHVSRPGLTQHILAVASDPNEAVQVAAMEALAVNLSPEAEPAITAALEKGAKRVKAAAATTYLRLGQAYHRSGKKPKALAIFHKLLEAAADREATIAALGHIGQIASKESAALVERHFGGRTEVREAAAKAHIAIATALAAGGDRKTAVAMLTKVRTLGDKVAASADAALALRAIGEQVAVPARDGIVSSWWIIGAWPAGQADWAKPLFPEKEVDLLKTYPLGGRKLAWKPLHTDDPDGAVMLDDLVTPNDAAVAYAYTELHVAKAQDVVFEVASDDGCILWLNGKKLYAHLAPRGWGTPPDQVKAQLVAGANRLLLKACEGSGTWGFRLRVKDPQGRPVAFRMR